jgi:hypothetical protein
MLPVTTIASFTALKAFTIPPLTDKPLNSTFTLEPGLFTNQRVGILFKDKSGD